MVDWYAGDICEIHDSPDECAESGFECESDDWEESSISNIM